MTSYFDLVMAKCGVSKIRIVGLAEDWEKAAQTCEQLGQILFKATDKLNELAGLFRLIWASRHSSDVMRNMFRIDKCFSGHDTVTGHMVTLWNLSANISTKDDLPSTTIDQLQDSACVTILDEITDAVWRKGYGVYSSTLDADGYFNPQMNRVIMREHVPLSVKREAQDRLGSNANLENDPKYASAARYLSATFPRF